MTEILYPPPPKHEQLVAEYEQINENFRELAEIRFKLLGLTPTLGGVAVFALSLAGFASGPAAAQTGVEAAALVAVVSIFGFLAALGIVMYDQRNSELYNALVHRAKYLEEFFKSPNSPGALRKRQWGGQFQERPPRYRFLFGRYQMGHDTGLALIYGPVLGAWFFPAGIAVGRILNGRSDVTAMGAAVVALAATAIFIQELIRLDREDQKRWQEAGQKL